MPVSAFRTPAATLIEEEDKVKRSTEVDEREHRECVCDTRRRDTWGIITTRGQNKNTYSKNTGPERRERERAVSERDVILRGMLGSRKKGEDRLSLSSRSIKQPKERKKSKVLSSGMSPALAAHPDDI